VTRVQGDNKEQNSWELAKKDVWMLAKVIRGKKPPVLTLLPYRRLYAVQRKGQLERSLLDIDISVASLPTDKSSTGDS